MTDNRNALGLLPAWEYAATNGDFIDLCCGECADTIRASDGMVPGDYWGWQTPDGGVILGALSFPHTYESDYPHSCFVCGGYLDTGLTDDGVAYIRENIPASLWPLWGVEA